MKSKLIHCILTISYIVVSLVGMILFPILINQSWIGTYLICLLAFLALGFVGLVLYHSLISKYECPHCQHQFKINFFVDLTSLGSSRGKNVTCPNCKNKNYVKKIN